MKWLTLVLVAVTSSTAAAQRIPVGRAAPPATAPTTTTVVNSTPTTTTPSTIVIPGSSSGGPITPSQSLPTPPTLTLPGQAVTPGLTSERVVATQPRVLPSTEPGVAPLVTASQLTPALPIGTISQAQVQLANLGFLRGPVTGTLTGPTRAALRQFQAGSGIPVTGELDVETAQRLGVLVPAGTQQVLVVPVGPTDVGSFEGVGTTVGSEIPTVQFRQDVGPVVQP